MKHTKTKNDTCCNCKNLALGFTSTCSPCLEKKKASEKEKASDKSTTNLENEVFCDYDVARLVLQNIPESYHRQMLNCYKNAKRVDNNLVWNVKLSMKDEDGFCRYSYEPYENPATMMREYRSELFADNYHDIDLVNCRVSVYCYGLKQVGMKVPNFLHRLCSERDEVFAEQSASDPSLDRDSLKKNINCILGLSRETLTDAFSTAAKSVWEKVLKKFVKQLLKKKLAKKVLNEKNQISYPKTIDTFFRKTEREIWDTMNKTFPQDLYIYDGGLVSKEKVKAAGKSIAQLCDEINEAILQQHDYPFKVVCKPMKKTDIIMDFARRTKEQSDKYFELAVMDKLPSFEDKMVYFEKFYRWIRNLNTYYYRDADRSVAKSFSDVQRELKPIQIQIETKDKDGNKKKKNVPFLDYYERSIKKTEARNLDFHPNPLMVDKNDFNIWTPYKKVPTKPEGYDECIRIWKMMLSVITGDTEQNLGYADYIIDSIADAFQRPVEGRGQKVVIVIYGAKGTGKGAAIVDTLKWAFGGSRVMTTCKVGEVFGSFNINSLGKNIVIFDEASIDKDNYATMKHYCVNAKGEYTKKGKDTTSCNNPSTYFVLHNGKYPIMPDTMNGVRRLFIVAPSTAFKQEDTSKTSIFKIFYDLYGPGAPHHQQYKDSIYRFIMKRKIQIKSFQAQVPKTTAYNKLMGRTINPRYRFLGSAIQNKKMSDALAWTSSIDDIKKISWESLEGSADEEAEYWKQDCYTKFLAVDKEVLLGWLESYFRNEMNDARGLGRIKKKEFMNDVETYFGWSKPKQMSVLGQRKTVYIFKPKDVMDLLHKKKMIQEYEGKVQGNEKVPPAPNDGGKTPSPKELIEQMNTAIKSV